MRIPSWRKDTTVPGCCEFFGLNSIHSQGLNGFKEKVINARRQLAGKREWAGNRIYGQDFEFMNRIEFIHKAHSYLTFCAAARLGYNAGYETIFRF
jgi:hypothetical protein